MKTRKLRIRKVYSEKWSEWHYYVEEKKGWIFPRWYYINVSLTLDNAVRKINKIRKADEAQDKVVYEVAYNYEN